MVIKVGQRDVSAFSLSLSEILMEVSRKIGVDVDANTVFCGKRNLKRYFEENVLGKRWGNWGVK